jgi:cellobiose transport system substrate-binding protein
MSVRRRRLRCGAAMAAVAVTVLGAGAACGSNDDNGSSSGAKPDKLVVDTFGEMGFDELVKQYEKDSGIKIELRKTAQLGDFKPKLVRYLATGKGAGCVTALEEGVINEFKLNPTNWVDLSKHLPDHSSEYLAWKWERGKAQDGRLMGLPTDVGSLSVAYRTDLFKAAGLPTDRDQVSALWPTWEKFIETGQKYKQATNKGFLDSVTAVGNAVMFQQNGADIFYDKQDNLILDKSPVVKAAWDQAIALADAGMTAKTQTWTPEWNAGFKQGTFAVTFAPSWMLGIIKDNSGAENSGKWDVAAVPGGAGNWGGSWLGVPSQCEYPEEAAKLAEFLTNASSQVAEFKLKGPLPTNLKALQDPAFTGYTDPYFSNAPTG